MSKRTAWRVDVDVFVGIVPQVGWRRTERAGGVFRFKSSAERYARDYTGVRSIFVPYVSYRSTITEVARDDDWLDRWLFDFIFGAREAAR